MRRLEDRPSIQAAPMADTAFLLIIFFMLTATMTANRGLDQTFNDEVAEPSPAIAMDVDRQGRLSIAGRDCGDIRSLSAQEVIVEMAAEKDQPFWVRIDRSAPYEIFTASLETLILCRAMEPKVTWVIPSGDEIAGVADSLGSQGL